LILFVKRLRVKVFWVCFYLLWKKGYKRKLLFPI